MRPRDFVLKNNCELKGCAYTVLPMISNGMMLDLPFHISRLKYSHEALIGNLSGSKWSTDIVLDACARCLGEFCNKDETGSPGVLTVCVGRSDSGIARIFTADAMYTPMPTLFQSIDGLVVDTHVYTRQTHTSIKAGSWPLERESLVRKKNVGTSETLLCRNIDTSQQSKYNIGAKCITEGFISNFFAIDEEGAIITAPDEYALSGSMQRIVLAVASELGIPVKRALPMLPYSADGTFKSRSPWKTAFLTSATKPIATISSILDTNGQEIIRLPEPSTCSTLSKLREGLDKVLRDQENDFLKKQIPYDLWSCSTLFAESSEDVVSKLKQLVNSSGLLI